MKFLRIASCFLLIVFIYGCATVGRIDKAPLSKGVPKTFTADFDIVLKAAREAIIDEGFAIEKDYTRDSTNWILIGKKSFSAFSGGEIIRVLVERTGDITTTVRVFSKQRLPTLTEKGDHSENILSRIAWTIRRLKMQI